MSMNSLKFGGERCKIITDEKGNVIKCITENNNIQYYLGLARNILYRFNPSEDPIYGLKLSSTYIKDNVPFWDNNLMRRSVKGVGFGDNPNPNLFVKPTNSIGDYILDPDYSGGIYYYKGLLNNNISAGSGIFKVNNKKNIIGILIAIDRLTGYQENQYLTYASISTKYGSKERVLLEAGFDLSSLELYVSYNDGTYWINHVELPKYDKHDESLRFIYSGIVQIGADYYIYCNYFGNDGYTFDFLKNPIAVDNNLNGFKNLVNGASEDEGLTTVSTACAMISFIEKLSSD